MFTTHWSVIRIFWQLIYWCLFTAQPPPSVQWYEGDQLVDDSYQIVSKGGRNSTSFKHSDVRNELELAPLTRSDLGRRLTCAATNNNETQPATRTVVLAMIRECLLI